MKKKLEMPYKQKNVMLLIGYLRNGGAERSIINLAEHLSKYHNVILVVASTRLQDYPCSVKIIEVKELRNKKKKIIGLMRLRELKKKYQIDTTISYTTAYNFFNVMSKYKDKTVISIRNHLSTKQEGFFPTIMHKISLKLCNLIVCCSNSVREDQIKNYHADPKKTVTITNFCNLDNIKNEINKKFSKEDELLLCDDLIVVMARLVPHKGHKHIIKAMSLVVKSRPNAKLLIFSRGPLKEELEELVKKYKLEKNIIFMDFHQNPHQFLNKAKCFVLASDYEGFPNVVIEAMACGTPVIATDSPGGSKEILMENVNSTNTTKLTKTDYGILIPSFINEHNKETITHNEKILKEAILLILENQDIYQHYHKKSLERIKKYESNIVIKDWLNII
jgi:glycosyltransferase involved in cell wall biosynthesis